MPHGRYYRAEDAIWDADWIARQAEIDWYEEWRARRRYGDREGALDARDALRSLAAARHPLRLWLREHAAPDTKPDAAYDRMVDGGMSELELRAAWGDQ